jgi:hypothetical protein
VFEGDLSLLIGGCVHCKVWTSGLPLPIIVHDDFGRNSSHLNSNCSLPPIAHMAIWSQPPIGHRTACKCTSRHKHRQKPNLLDSVNSNLIPKTELLTVYLANTKQGAPCTLHLLKHHTFRRLYCVSLYTPAAASTIDPNTSSPTRSSQLSFSAVAVDEINVYP